MSDISITPANVRRTANTGTVASSQTAGENLTQGLSVYLSSNQWFKTKASNETQSEVGGITLNAASANQPISVAQGAAIISIGGTTSNGTPYVVSNTSGAICPYADLISGQYVSFIGVGGPNNTISLGLDPTGLTIP